MATPASPLYFRIQETLRHRILSGQLSVGARVPSESQLAEEYETTRGTVRQALAALTFEGLVVRRMGSGTFVAPRRIEGHLEAGRPGAFEEQMERAGAHVSFRLIGFESAAASPDVAATLRIAPGTATFRLRRLRLVDGEIVGFEDRWMLERIGASISASALATRSAIAMTETALGSPLGGVSVSVGAEPASNETAGLLEIRRGTPVLIRAHTFFDGEGLPILTGASVYRGERYRFTFEFGRTSG